MPLETASNISELNEAWPIGDVDFLSTADDHLRLIKAALKNTFTDITGKAGPGTLVMAINGTVGAGVQGVRANSVTGSNDIAVFSENPTFNADASNVGIRKSYNENTFSINNELAYQNITGLNIDNLKADSVYIVSGHLTLQCPSTTSFLIRLINSQTGFATLNYEQTRITATAINIFSQEVSARDVIVEDETLVIEPDVAARFHSIDFSGVIVTNENSPRNWNLSIAQSDSVAEQLHVYSHSWIKAELFGIS